MSDDSQQTNWIVVLTHGDVEKVIQLYERLALTLAPPITNLADLENRVDVKAALDIMKQLSDLLTSKLEHPPKGDVPPPPQNSSQLH
jgi:hypothetical protein